MNTIKVRENGPLLCEGNIELYDADGGLIETTQNVALCRCGASLTAPYCDGSHAEAFQDSGQFEDPKPAELENPDEPLVITCRENAMYVVKGPFTMKSHDGASETTRNKAILCRCGLSEKKPFCDASHKQCGWIQPI